MALEIRPVRGRRDLRTFIRLPWRLYRSHRNWVPPLLMEQRKLLDRDKNPFFAHAEAEFFLALRDGRAVGRITAHLDRNFNEFQGNDWGMFGFFECEDDPEAATALLATAEAWLRERDRDRMIGPLNFSTNDECGVMIEGHDRPPMILSPYSHTYYPALIEGAGLVKGMDLLMWELSVRNRDDVLPVIWELAGKVESEHNVITRRMRKRDLEAEVGRFLEVYNAAWERNWGFVPLTDDEVRHYAKDLRPVLDERWAYVAERDGEVLGASLTLPDFNQVLIRLNGRLLPFGWIKALWHKRKIDAVRVFALGVKPEYQHTGIAAKFYEMHWDAAEETGSWGGEMGWILETNTAMNRGMEAMGGKIVRRFRVYERVLNGADSGSAEEPVVGQLSVAPRHGLRRSLT